MSTFWLIASFIFIIIVLSIISWSRFSLSAKRTDESCETRVAVGLIFNILRVHYVQERSGKSIRFSFLGKASFKKIIHESERPKRAKGVKPARARKGKLNRFKGIPWVKFRFRLQKLFSGFWNVIMEGEIRAGLTNPMHTGTLMGFYSALSEVLPGVKNRIVFEPDFCGRKLAWNLNFSTDFIPAKTAWHGLLLWRILR